MTATYPHLMDFRYLDSLDSIRFDPKMDFSEIRTLHAKADMLISLIFGDGIIVSENQLIDSKGFLEIVSKLIPLSRKGIFIPVRVALRDIKAGIYKSAATLFSKVEENDLDSRFRLSSYYTLDNNPSRRKIWAKYLGDGERIPKEYVWKEEEEIYEDLWEILRYFGSQFYGEYSIVKSKNIPIVFSSEISQIGLLNDNNFENLFVEQPDPQYKNIFHPAWLKSQQRNEAREIIDTIRELLNTSGGEDKSIKTRSIIHNKVAQVTSNINIQNGVREVADTIYNYNVGISIGADHLSDTTLRDIQNKYIATANCLGTWAKETTVLPIGIVHSNPYGWYEGTGFTFENILSKSDNQRILAQIPLEDCLNMWSEPEWKNRIAEYKFRRDVLQAINKGIATSASNRYWEWEKRHVDARKYLRDAWASHVEFCSKYITDVTWEKPQQGEILDEATIDLMDNYKVKFRIGEVEINGRILVDMVNSLKNQKRQKDIRGVVSDLAEASKIYKGE